MGLKKGNSEGKRGWGEVVNFSGSYLKNIYVKIYTLKKYILMFPPKVLFISASFLFQENIRVPFFVFFQKFRFIRMCSLTLSWFWLRLFYVICGRPLREVLLYFLELFLAGAATGWDGVYVMAENFRPPSPVFFNLFFNRSGGGGEKVILFPELNCLV